MTIGSQEMIRDINRRLVLETIVNNELISRAELAKKLKLTKATISNIVQELIEEDLIIEIGSGETAVGRKPILLSFNKNCGYSVAVDIGVTCITILTSDLKGENCAVREYAFPHKDHFLSSLKELIRKVIQTLPPSAYGVIGISIGIYGVVCDNKISFTPYYDLSLPCLGQLIEEEFKVPVIVENEANLSVLGESAFHYGYKNMIHINIHDGIGMGILIDGQLYTGHDGYAGEFGHTILIPDGKPCPCGNHGCLEQYASEQAILSAFMLRNKQSSASIEDFLRAYQSHDAYAVELMRLFVKYMGIAINNILNTFNADLIVINSSFTNSIPSLNQEIQNVLPQMPHRDYRIIPSELQDIAELIGGVRVSVERFLGIEHLKIEANPRKNRPTNN